MSIDGLLCLAPGVHISPARELEETLRARAGASEDDYLVTRDASRERTRVISRDSAELFELFEEPTTIVNAVIRFSRMRGLEPERVLVEASETLFDLFESGALAAASNELAKSAGLDQGQIVAGFRLLRRLQHLDDSDVFLAQDPRGAHFAFKYLPARNGSAALKLGEELRLLQLAPRSRVPAESLLVETSDGVALATRWVFGVDAVTHSEYMRERLMSRNEPKLLATIVDLARAYAELHEAGILHGDVHPRNIVVGTGGTVLLIDFGNAVQIGVETTTSRGGVPFYFDPELALAILTGAPGLLTERAEQYSVAALIYQMWTGYHYVNWQLGRDELLQQIAEELPTSFLMRRVPAWPGLEAVIFRALSKSPEKRYKSMREFTQALEALLEEVEHREPLSTNRNGRGSQTVDAVNRAVARYATNGDLYRRGIEGCPAASLTYGATGVAYALLRVAEQRCDSSLLYLADCWIERAFADSSKRNAFYAQTLQIEPATVGRGSLFHSEAGLSCVRSLVSAAMGDLVTSAGAMRDYCLLCERQCINDDAMLGTGSLLLGCSELLEGLAPLDLVDLSPLLSTGARLQEKLLDAACNTQGVGIAHGWTGMAFAHLRWSIASHSSPAEPVLARIRELGRIGIPHAGGLTWPSSASDSAMAHSWCNGGAGITMLLSLAAHSDSSGQLAELADRAAVSLQAANTSNPCLCCGLAGISYAFLAAGRATSSATWLDHARGFARRATECAPDFQVRDSLYKGALGVALLSAQLDQADGATMPMFEPRR